jgi:hypothetical protein
MFGLLSGVLRDKYAVLFLKVILVTSVLGLLVPFPRRFITEREAISMLTVYASGIAILAWYRYRLAAFWGSIFALSFTITLYFSVLAVIAQVSRHMSLYTALAPAQFKSPFFVTHVAVMLIFVVLGVVAERRSRSKMLCR